MSPRVLNADQHTFQKSPPLRTPASQRSSPALRPVVVFLEKLQYIHFLFNAKISVEGTDGAFWYVFNGDFRAMLSADSFVDDTKTSGRQPLFQVIALLKIFRRRSEEREQLVNETP